MFRDSNAPDFRFLCRIRPSKVLAAGVLFPRWTAIFDRSFTSFGTRLRSGFTPRGSRSAQEGFVYLFDTVLST